MTGELLSKPQLTLLQRRHVKAEFYDESDLAPSGTPSGIALYTLSDPRDIRAVRYVGQTSAPRRRFFQHLNAACLWLPDERDWWVDRPAMRPLYEWIRELYRDERRLPTMVVNAWEPSVRTARLAERAKIYRLMTDGAALLNVESEILGSQLPLI